MCRVDPLARLEGDTSSLGLGDGSLFGVGILSGEEPVGLVVAVRTILTLISRRDLFEGVAQIYLKIVKETCGKKYSMSVDKLDETTRGVNGFGSTGVRIA